MLRGIDFDRVIRELKDRNAKTVGVQLPDGLKYKCDEIARCLVSNGFRVIISGSGCYGACDVDLDLLKEVDILLHLAHTPIFDLEGVLYVPYFIDYDPKEVRRLRIEEKRLALIASAQYAWKLGEVKAILEEMGHEVELKTGSGRVRMPGQVLGCNYTVLRDSKAEAVLFIGDGLFHPIGAKIYTGKKVYRFSPLDKEFEEVEVEDFLKRRMLSVSKAMEADKGAILVSRKIGQKRLGLAMRLKGEAERAGKHVDVIYLDEITPEKLSNFLYGYYVNTACPRISYDDFELFKVPILTPQEFEILIGVRDWEKYEMDEIP